MVGEEERKQDTIVQSVACHMVTSAMEDVVPARGARVLGNRCGRVAILNRVAGQDPLRSPWDSDLKGAASRWTRGREFPLKGL